MAFRRPLYIDETQSLREMSDSQIESIQTTTFYKYLEAPSVLLRVVSTGGNIGTMVDTRIVSGAFRTFVNRFPTEAETNETTVVSVNISRITQNFASALPVTDSSNIAFPVYYTADNNIRSMSVQDMYDTFIEPAIDSLIVGDNIYSISTSTTKSGYSLVSETPIFTDTATDASVYVGPTIPTTFDQSSAYVNDNYYLFQRNVSGASYSFTPPVKIGGTNRDATLSSYETDDFELLLQNLVRYAARDVNGMKIRYTIDGSGNNSGTVTDRRLNGSGLHVTQFINENDYRAQEWPNGSLAVYDTFVLRVRKI